MSKWYVRCEDERGWIKIIVEDNVRCQEVNYERRRKWIKRKKCGVGKTKKGASTGKNKIRSGG